MNTRMRLMAFLVAALACSAASAQQSPAPSPPATGTGMSMQDTKVVEVKIAMRKLWQDHITYTRNYIISALAGLPDGDAVAKRLL
jgi:hypothetical protein